LAIKSFKEQIESIQHLSFRNTQAYYWFTYDLFIEEHRRFKNEAKQEIMTTIESDIVRSFFKSFKSHDQQEGVFWKEFNNKKTSLMNYVLLLFDLKGDLSKPENMFNYQKIKEILFCGEKNEQGMMVYGLLKSVGKSYANALYHYNIATASFYMDRNSLSELKLTSQEQYDMMESRIQKALETQKEVVEIDIFKMKNDEIVSEAIREFRKNKKHE